MKSSHQLGVDLLFDEAHGSAFGCLGGPKLGSGDGTIQQVHGRDRGIKDACGDSLNEGVAFSQNSHVSDELVASEFGPSIFNGGKKVLEEKIYLRCFKAWMEVVVTPKGRNKNREDALEDLSHAL